MLRLIASVVAGFVLWSILWLGFNQVLIHMGVVPAQPVGAIDATGVLITLLLGSVIFSIVAGYVAAMIARTSRQTAVLVLGVLLLLVGAFVQWQYRDLMPYWYHIAFLVLLLPMCLIGGRLRRA